MFQATFLRLIKQIKKQDSHDQELIAQALHDLIGAASGGDTKWDFSSFLDRFYMSRISIRMLMGQYIAIHGRAMKGQVGIITEALKPADVVRQAATDAGNLCAYYYGEEPAVAIEGDVETSLAYVPAHLYYILFELLKNSMRATCEFRAGAPSLPEVSVVIAEGDDDICIKISDRGGGIARKGMTRLWTYAYTTAKSAHETIEHRPSKSPKHSPMAGFGHGLPLSRLYARYWSGDVQIISMQNFGTDVYVHVNRLGNENEQLPD